MRVLVVEDDVKVAAAVRRGLEAEGFAVDVAADGDDGLWRATEGTYDAIVLDLMLPGRNGFQVCADLRATGDWTPVLVLTAKGGEWDEVEALDTGADDFLGKPFSFPVLVARLRALLRRPAPVSGGGPFAAGDLRVDPGARRAWRGDTELTLTAREHDVLAHLVRRPGVVVSKDDVLAAVWADDDGDRDANLVEVYVRRLRRKIDEPFGRHTIETVRGAGYRVVDDGWLRRRLTAAAAAVLVVVLAVTAVALVVAQRRLLTSALDDTIERRATDLATLVVDGELPSVLATIDDDDAVQVLAPDGRVLAASAQLEGDEPIAAAPSRGELVRTVHLPRLDDGPIRLLSRRLDDGTVVHVAASSDDIDEAVSALARSLAVTVPLLTAALTAAVWWLVGRTLEPVTAASHRQQRFVADAAHELRGPLTRMRTELEVDLAHPGGADLIGTHMSALEEVVGLQRLVGDLLHLARNDAGAAPRRRERVDLGAVARRQAARAGGDGLVEVTVGDDTIVNGHPADLDRMVANLLDNAVRHARKLVRVDVHRAGPDVVVAVVDDGPGIPAAERERVFERFARVDDSRTAGTGGAGLGLAIVREVVQRHGGTVAVDPEHRPGTRLVVTLPR